MNHDTSTQVVIWEYFPDTQTIGTVRYPQNEGESYPLGTDLADRLNQYQRDNQCLFDSVNQSANANSKIEEENQKLRELLARALVLAANHFPCGAAKIHEKLTQLIK